MYLVMFVIGVDYKCGKICLEVENLIYSCIWLVEIIVCFNWLYFSKKNEEFSKGESKDDIY